MTDKQQDIIDLGELVDLNSARGRLQQAAASLFKAKGYSKTTVRDIAAKVGIQSGSIFHHFKNKEQILQCVMADSILRVLSSMQASLAVTSDLTSQLECLILCELQAIHDEQLSGFRLLILEWRSLNESNQQKILILRDRYEKVWDEILDKAYQAGLVNIESFYLRAFIRGALIETSNWYQVSGSVSLEALAHKLMNAFIQQDHTQVTP